MEQDSPLYNLLLQYNPSERAMLDWLVPHINDAHLREIAQSDYGNEEKEHFQELKRIHEGKPIPAPLLWNPSEVLTLTRWNEPDDLKYKGGRKGLRGHLIRAFCCAVLLQAGDAPEAVDYTYADGENQTLIQLIESVLLLGRGATESALRLLSWRLLRLEDEEEGETAFFGLAILLLRATLFEPHENGEDLNLLAEWIVSKLVGIGNDWLQGLTLFNQYHEKWKRLTQEILLNPAKHFPEPSATAMRGIVQRLTLLANPKGRHESTKTRPSQLTAPPRYVTLPAHLYLPTLTPGHQDGRQPHTPIGCANHVPHALIVHRTGLAPRCDAL